MTDRIWVDVLRVLALACAAVLLSAHAPAPTAKASPIETLDAHPGATALFHDGDLWVSTAQDWDRPSPVRMSRGRGAIERTLRGYLAGVHRGRALVAVPSGAELAIQRVGLAGEPITLGSIPRGDYRFAVTSSGELVAVEREPRAIRVIGEGAMRLHPVGQTGEEIVSMASAPHAPRIALVLDHRSGPHIERGARILVSDTRTGAVVRERPLGRNLRGGEGEAAFDATGTLWVHLHDRFLRIDAEGESASLRGVSIDARNLVVAADGSTIAYTETDLSGCMSLASPACRVYSVRTDAHRSHRALRTDDGDCYFGRGMAFVGHTLWVAPP